MKPQFQVYCLAWLLCCVGFTSCMTRKYQHVETTWNGMDSTSKSIPTPDRLLSVMPKMGNRDGQMLCSIHNASDSTIYIYPYYSFAVMPTRDTVYLSASRLYSISDSTKRDAFDRNVLYESQTEARPFPIPPKGTLKWYPGTINNYIGLDKENYNPAVLATAKYSEWESPYPLQIHTAYAMASDSVLHVSKARGYVSAIHPYRRFSSSATADKFKKLPNDFFAYEERVSGFTAVMVVIFITTIAVLGGGEE